MWFELQFLSSDIIQNYGLLQSEDELWNLEAMEGEPFSSSVSYGTGERRDLCEPVANHGSFMWQETMISCYVWTRSLSHHCFISNINTLLPKYSNSYYPTKQCLQVYGDITITCFKHIQTSLWSCTVLRIWLSLTLNVSDKKGKHWVCKEEHFRSCERWWPKKEHEI